MKQGFLLVDEVAAIDFVGGGLQDLARREG